METKCAGCGTEYDGRKTIHPKFPTWCKYNPANPLNLVARSAQRPAGKMSGGKKVMLVIGAIIGLVLGARHAPARLDHPSDWADRDRVLGVVPSLFHLAHWF